MNLVLDAFLFFLPAGFANMAPVLANKVPLLNHWQTPLDFGKKYRGKRIFGNNKTWRGLVSGIVLAGVVAYAEARFFPRASAFETIGLTTLAGAFMGFGALMGDAIESFFKRRMGVKSGSSWFPFDQIDYIVGGLAAVIPLVFPKDWALFLTVFILYFALNVLVSYIGYLLGLKTQPI